MTSIFSRFSSVASHLKYISLRMVTVVVGMLNPETIGGVVSCGGSGGIVGPGCGVVVPVSGQL